MELSKRQNTLIDLALQGGSNKDLILLDLIHSLEDKVSELESQVSEKVDEVEGRLPDLNEILDSVRGEKGDKGDTGDTGPLPSDEHLTTLITPLIPKPIKGDSYILTTKDKKEIAQSIKVPIIEKVIETVIEKTEVIKELPIITNEIKEVAVIPESVLIDIEDLKKFSKQERIPGWGAHPLVIQSSGVVKVKTARTINFTGATVTQSPDGVTTIATSGSMASADLSSQTDGQTKTFTIPSTANILQLTGSDAPNIYRPTVDFTFTTTTLTLTDAVNAPSLGATLILLYTPA